MKITTHWVYFDVKKRFQSCEDRVPYSTLMIKWIQKQATKIITDIVDVLAEQHIQILKIRIILLQPFIKFMINMFLQHIIHMKK